MRGTMRGMRGVRGIAISLLFTHDHIVGSSVELIEVMCFLKFTADQVMEFYWITGSSISQIIRTKLKIFSYTSVKVILGNHFLIESCQTRRPLTSVT